MTQTAQQRTCEAAWNVVAEAVEVARVVRNSHEAANDEWVTAMREVNAQDRNTMDRVAHAAWTVRHHAENRAAAEAAVANAEATANRASAVCGS